MKTTCYLKIEPRFGADGHLRSLRVAGANTTYAPDGISVKVTLDLPESVFLPLGPVDVTITEGDLSISVDVHPPEHR